MLACGAGGPVTVRGGWCGSAWGAGGHSLHAFGPRHARFMPMLHVCLCLTCVVPLHQLLQAVLVTQGGWVLRLQGAACAVCLPGGGCGVRTQSAVLECGALCGSSTGVLCPVALAPESTGPSVTNKQQKLSECSGQPVGTHTTAHCTDRVIQILCNASQSTQLHFRS